MSIHKNIGSLIAAALFGSVVTYAVVSVFMGSHPTDEKITEATEKKPLYWVAPMDANYKRDKPGKSPMGMELIPVYGADNSKAGAGPGTVTISSEDCSILKFPP